MSEVYLGSVFVKCEPVCCMLTVLLFLDSTADPTSLMQKVRVGMFLFLCKLNISPRRTHDKEQRK